MTLVKGYFTDRKTKEENEGLKPNDVFIALNENYDREGNQKTCYAPIGQHSSYDLGHLKECKEITKEEYLKASKGLYTPEEYL